ncbi:MAG: UDP-glucose 4-epimerase GalE [Clostridia bacterium]|nr:UDP-glucose 4-epimerase GalE [Clostridia bacterium]
MILLIMAAGMGSRYGGMKQIDPVGQSGEFIVDYSIYDAKRAGFDKVIFVIKPEMREDFERTVGSRVRGMKIEYAYQLLDDIPEGATIPEGRVKPWGTGHAVYAARDLIDENFAVINADDFYGREAFEVVGNYLRTAKPGQYCMAGFRLENTVTEHGSVSRGICTVDDGGMLTDVVERTKIEITPHGIEYIEKEERFPLDPHVPVSMNFWGFTPDFKDVLSKGFANFMKTEHERPLKDEYYLPTAVREAMAGGATVKVLNTGAKWFGVTYREDREQVTTSVGELIEKGEYGKTLWRGSVLVTGGAGFIGSHTIVRLLEDGEDIVILDNFSNSSPDVIDLIKQISGTGVKLYCGDMRDRAILEKIFTENDIEAVIHFAGLKAVGESVQKPLEYYDNNIGGTVTLLEAMRDHGCKKMIFSSSATVYGSDNEAPFTEDMKTSATNPYGWTKVFIEHILEGVCTSDPGFCAVMLRYFNPIGAHESGLIGERPNGIPNNLMPYIMKVAKGELPHLNVFGDDYNTVDGTGVRDYIHVVDLADGHAAALRYARKNTGAEAVNLGTGKGTSVLQLVTAFEKASGKKVPYVIAPRRPGDIAECYADVSKAERVFGWRARYDVAEMCRDSANFADKN